MRRIVAVLGLCALVTGSLCTRAIANQTAQQEYCEPPNTLSQGQTINAPPLQQDLAHAEQCGGQYGDLWTDGPLYNPAFSYSGSSFGFTIPSMVWIVLGQRIFTAAMPENAPGSITSYWWLSSATGQFTYTITSSPPDGVSDLEYTITTNSSGITSVTNATMASLMINGGLSLSGLPSGSCLQTSTGGLVTATGVACGSGGSGIASVSGSGNITASTLSGAVTVGEVNSPSWSGTATATNGFSTGSSSYGPTSASVNGGITGSSLTATSSNVTGCFLCYGTLGFGSTAVLRFGSAASGSAYTSIGAGNAHAIDGVTDSLLGIGNTGTAEFSFDGSGNLGTNGSVNAVGNVTASKVLQNASNEFAGTCTNSVSTGCSATISSAYTSPLCFAQDQSNSNKVDVVCTVSGTTVIVQAAHTSFDGNCTMATATTCTITAPYQFIVSNCVVSATTATTTGAGCAISGTTITVTATASNSLTWDVILRGSATITGHTFSFFVVGNPN